MSKKTCWDADRQRWTTHSGVPGEPDSVPMAPVPANPAYPILGALASLVLATTILLGIDPLSAEGFSDGDETETARTHEEAREESDEESMFVDEKPADHGTDFEFEEEEEEDPAPYGYTLRTDSAGFELHVPEGWYREEDASGVFYTPNDRRDLIQVMTFDDGVDTPGEAMEQVESDVWDRSGYAEYDRFGSGLRTGVTEFAYGYDHGDHGDRHVFARTFVGEDGEVHGILAAGPAEDRDLTWGHVQEATHSFCVSGCG